MLIINLLLSLSLLGFSSGILLNSDIVKDINYIRKTQVTVLDRYKSTNDLQFKILLLNESSPITPEISTKLQAVKVKVPVVEAVEPKPPVTSEKIIKSTSVKKVVKSVVAQPVPVEATPSGETLPDFETYINQMCAKYGCNAEQLVRVMYCESGGKQSSVGGKGKYIGLFQFLSSTFYANAGLIPNADIYNGYHQIEVAAKMFAEGQAGQWSCK